MDYNTNEEIQKILKSTSLPLKEITDVTNKILNITSFKKMQLDNDLNKIEQERKRLDFETEKIESELQKLKNPSQPKDSMTNKTKDNSDKLTPLAKKLKECTTFEKNGDNEYIIFDNSFKISSGGRSPKLIIAGNGGRERIQTSNQNILDLLSKYPNEKFFDAVKLLKQG